MSLYRPTVAMPDDKGQKYDEAEMKENMNDTVGVIVHQCRLISVFECNLIVERMKGASKTPPSHRREGLSLRPSLVA